MRNCLWLIKKSMQCCKRRFFCIFAVALLDAVNAVNIVLFYKYAVRALEAEKVASEMLKVVLIYLFIHALRSVVNNYLTQMKFPLWNETIKLTLTREIYEHYEALPVARVEDPKFYDAYIKALNEADTRVETVFNLFQGVLGNLFSAFGLVTVIASMNRLLLLLAVVPVCTSALFNMKISKMRYDYDMKRVRPNRRIDYITRVFYQPEYREEIRLHENTLLKKKYEEAFYDLNETSKKEMPKIILCSALGANLFSALNYGIPMILLGWQVFHGFCTIGEFSTGVIGAANLSSSLFGIWCIIPGIREQSLYIQNLRDFLEVKNAQTGETKVSAGLHEIVLKNVRFYYEGNRNRDVIAGVDFRIREGEKIAFVGENGAGKTTLVKLIEGLYRPTSGEILLDGKPYECYDQKSFHDAVAIVQQQSNHYSFTIAENILMHEVRSEEDQKHVKEVLEESGLWERVSALPRGMDTPLGNEFDKDGVDFSGGEKQKLAIARALYKNASIFIMDEPANSLDPMAEAEMYERMTNLGRNRTQILISHRLYSTRKADRIYYIEEGKIAEAGSHEELMQRHGRYASMYQLQMSLYASGENGKDAAKGVL